MRLRPLKRQVSLTAQSTQRHRGVCEIFEERFERPIGALVRERRPDPESIQVNSYEAFELARLFGGRDERGLVRVGSHDLYPTHAQTPRSSV